MVLTEDTWSSLPPPEQRTQSARSRVCTVGQETSRERGELSHWRRMETCHHNSASHHQWTGWSSLCTVCSSSVCSCCHWCWVDWDHTPLLRWSPWLWLRTQEICCLNKLRYNHCKYMAEQPLISAPLGTQSPVTISSMLGLGGWGVTKNQRAEAKLSQVSATSSGLFSRMLESP